MVKIGRCGQLIELTEDEVFSCYKAWRTRQDYKRLKNAVVKDKDLVLKFSAATKTTEDGLIYLTLKELDRCYDRDEWKDPADVMFDIIAKYVPMGDLK